MSVDRTERFYQLLIRLQFKFLVVVFSAILMLQFGTTLQGFAYPVNLIGVGLYYGVYVLGLFALNVFREHKHIIDNIELYVPKDNPKLFSRYKLYLDSDILTDDELYLLHTWANGKSIKELHCHPMVLNRLLRKYVQYSLRLKNGELEKGNREVETAISRTKT